MNKIIISSNSLQIKEFFQLHQNYFKKFSIILNVNDKEINLTSYIINGESYFKGKDILKYLGYSVVKKSIKNKFKEIININDEYCMKLIDIFDMFTFIKLQNLKNDIQQNLKEYFISKPGLYYLIDNLKKNETNESKIFIYIELLLRIEQNIKDIILSNIKYKNEKNFNSKNSLKQIILQNDKLNNKSKVIITDLNNQNTTTFNFIIKTKNKNK